MCECNIFETRKAKLFSQNKPALSDESRSFPAAAWRPFLWVLCEYCPSAQNLRCVSTTPILLTDTMGPSHTSGLFRYRGNSVLTLLTREGGETFTYLTGPEKSQSRKKEKGQVGGGDWRRGTPGERQGAGRAGEEAPRKPWQRRLLGLRASCILHVPHEMLVHEATVTFALLLSQKVLDFDIGIKTDTPLLNGLISSGWSRQIFCLNSV